MPGGHRLLHISILEPSVCFHPISSTSHSGAKPSAARSNARASCASASASPRIAAMSADLRPVVPVGGIQGMGSSIDTLTGARIDINDINDINATAAATHTIGIRRTPR
jgi:hypothetical protein